MRSAVVLLSVLVVGSSAGAVPNGVPDSYCPNWVSYASGGPIVFRMDAQMANQTFGGVASHNEVAAFFDIALQNLARMSRGRFRGRVDTTAVTCSPNGLAQGDCITYLPIGHPDCSGTQAAFAGCSIRGCRLKVCADDGAFDGPEDFGDEETLQILTHEFGHIYGLAHTDGSTSTNPMCNDAAMNSPGCFLGTSDGCDGELMCSLAQCERSAFPSDGDGEGIRAGFDSLGGDHEGRRVYGISYGSPTGSVTTTKSTSGLPVEWSYYRPRLDCTQTTGTSTDCVMVNAFGGAIKAHTLKDNSPSSGAQWTTQDSHTLASGSFVATHAPDVTVDTYGDEAWAVYVDAQTDLIWVQKLNISGSGSLTTAWTTSLGSRRTVLPPRIEFVPGFGDPVVFYYEDLPDSLEQFSGPAIKAAKLYDLAGVPYVVDLPLPLGSPGNPQLVDAVPQGAFDVDCRLHGINESRCVFVATREEDAVATGFARSSYDLRMLKLAWFPWTEYTLAPADRWNTGVIGSNGAVVGVATQGVGNELYASSSRLTIGHSTSNTRITRWPSYTAIGGYTANKTYSLDAEPCDTHLHWSGEKIYGATMHGGTDVSYCADCGTMEGLTWGAPVSNPTFCY